MSVGTDLHDIITSLIRARIRLGLKQGDLADGLGITRQCLSAWENFVNPPPLDKLLLWAKMLGVRLIAVEVKADAEEVRATDNCAAPKTAVAA